MINHPRIAFFEQGGLMKPTAADRRLGTFSMTHEGEIVAGMRTAIRFVFRVGELGLRANSRIRIGIPNTGWEKPVAPQQRYWDELVTGIDRRLAPFHPVNTTATIRSARNPGHNLEVMERMLVPDEDPADAYWRWWITITIEGSALDPGDEVEILYGDSRFGAEGIRVQTFAEPSINVSAYIDPGGAGEFLSIAGTPIYIDVVSGPPSRANVVVESVRTGDAHKIGVSVTDDCHCMPAGDAIVSLHAGEASVECRPGTAAWITVNSPLSGFVTVRDANGAIWGISNPSIPCGADGLQLYWGDLHAQSEHHSMHSQAKDFAQEGWSKGLSSGTLEECYRYGREVSILDFIAITDQGACLTTRWEHCQRKVREFHEEGRFVVFKGFEAGAAIGHRNVVYSSDEIDKPLDAHRFHGFHPRALYEYFRGRNDVLIIPHHVKTWTDWSYHDPDLEPLMEIYSCWGQSESPSLDLWNKGRTPGAGAWEGLRRGYKLGMIASSDNHVGMPGRSYPGDRQVHTPFKGGLCAVWAASLTRASLFSALRSRRCYGTTGDRIILRFTIGRKLMGSVLPRGSGELPVEIEVYGTHALDRVELVSDLKVARVFRPEAPSETSMKVSASVAGDQDAFHYVRVFQLNGERAWSSPIWIGR
jgi:hypothetical protein